MSNPTFKENDLVYFPPLTSVYKLCKTDNLNYPVTFEVSDITDLEKVSPQFTIDGKASRHQMLPSIFHATKKSREAIFELFGVVVDEPPNFDEYIRNKLQEHNCAYVVCDVSTDPYSVQLELITSIRYTERKVSDVFTQRVYTFFNQHGVKFTTAVPVDGLGKRIELNQE